jgi:glycerophosphoryl diester phosphodiesterase
MPHPQGRPWIIAHRGASLQARENTIEAFRMAAALGADAVELDARRTADDVLIVHHDDTVAGSDRPIIAMTRRELRDLAPWVPDLAEAIEACRGMWVDVEVKNDPREPDWDPDDTVTKAIVANHRGDDIVVTSFNSESVAVASRAGLRTGWLIGRGIDPAAVAQAAATAGHELLLPHYSTMSDDHGSHILEAAGLAGVEVAVWTLDDPVEMKRLASLGVGGIATNAPDIAHSALNVL